MSDEKKPEQQDSVLSVEEEARRRTIVEHHDGMHGLCVHGEPRGNCGHGGYDLRGEKADPALALALAEELADRLPKTVSTPEIAYTENPSVVGPFIDAARWTPDDDVPSPTAGELADRLKTDPGRLTAMPPDEPITLTDAQARYVLAAQAAAMILRGKVSAPFAGSKVLEASEVCWLATEIIDAQAKAVTVEREALREASSVNWSAADTSADLFRQYEQGFADKVRERQRDYAAGWQQLMNRAFDRAVDRVEANQETLDRRSAWNAIFDRLSQDEIVRHLAAFSLESDGLIEVRSLQPGDMITDIEGTMLAAGVNAVHLEQSGRIRLEVCWRDSTALDEITWDDPTAKVRLLRRESE